MKLTFTCVFCVVLTFEFTHSLPVGGYYPSVSSDDSPQVDVNQLLRRYYTTQSEKQLNGFNNPFQASSPFMYGQSAQQLNRFAHLPDASFPVGYGPSLQQYQAFGDTGLPAGYEQSMQHFTRFPQFPETGLSSISGPPQQSPITSQNIYQNTMWPEAKYEAPYLPFDKSDYMFSSVDSNPLTSYTSYNKQLDSLLPSMPGSGLGLRGLANHNQLQLQSSSKTNPFLNEEKITHSGAPISLLSHRSLESKITSSATPKQQTPDVSNKKD